MNVILLKCCMKCHIHTCMKIVYVLGTDIWKKPTVMVAHDLPAFPITGHNNPKHKPTPVLSKWNSPFSAKTCCMLIYGPRRLREGEDRLKGISSWWRLKRNSWCRRHQLLKSRGNICYDYLCLSLDHGAYKYNHKQYAPGHKYIINILPIYLTPPGEHRGGGAL